MIKIKNVTYIRLSLQMPDRKNYINLEPGGEKEVTEEEKEWLFGRYNQTSQKILAVVVPEVLPYKCKYCDTSFKELNELGRHVRDVHKPKKTLDKKK